jgi:hypothetical protein
VGPSISRATRTAWAPPPPATTRAPFLGRACRGRRRCRCRRRPAGGGAVGAAEVAALKGSSGRPACRPAGSRLRQGPGGFPALCLRPNAGRRGAAGGPGRGEGRWGEYRRGQPPGTSPEVSSSATSFFSKGHVRAHALACWSLSESGILREAVFKLRQDPGRWAGGANLPRTRTDHGTTTCPRHSGPGPSPLEGLLPCPVPPILSTGTW